MRKLALALVVLHLCVSAASAQDAPPDPAAFTVPDLSQSGSPAAIEEGWKYFLFRKDGVKFAEAYSDFADCFHFMQPSSWQSVSMTRFVPWESKAGRDARGPTYNYGLVGALLGSMVEGTLNRRDYQARMRACMEPRGYIRYGVPQSIWEGVSRLPREQWAGVQAKIASGRDFGGKVPVK